MNNKRYIIGAILGISVISIGALCICINKKQPLEKDEGSFITTSSGAEEGSSDTASDGTEGTQEAAGVDTNSSEGASETVSDGTDEGTSETVSDDTEAENTEFVYIESEDSNGDIEVVIIDGTPVNNNGTPTEEYNEYEIPSEEELYAPADMTDEYNNTINDVFYGENEGITPQTVSPGCDEGGRK